VCRLSVYELHYTLCVSASVVISYHEGVCSAVVLVAETVHTDAESVGKTADGPLLLIYQAK
jgi:hypothetical protein